MKINKMAAGLIKAANDGQIKLVDDAAGKVASLEIKKIKSEAKDKEKKVTDYEKLQKNLKKNRDDIQFYEQKCQESLQKYWDATDAVNDFLMQIELKSSVKTIHNNTAIYKTHRDMLKTVYFDEICYKGLVKEVNEYSKVNLQYKKMITNIQKIEKDYIRYEKDKEKASDALTKTNDDIERLRQK